MFRNKSIQFKLLILIIVVLIPLISLRVVNIFTDHQKKVNSMLHSYQDLAMAISTAFNNYLEEIWTIEDITGTYITDNPTLSELEIYNYLSLIQQKQVGISRISWLDAQGNALISSDRHFKGISRSKWDYIQEIKDGKKKVVSNLVRGTINPYSYVLPVACAIYQKDKLAGIVEVVIDSDELGQKLPDLNTNQEILYYLIDSRGMIVYRSDIKKTPDININLSESTAVNQALEGNLFSSVKETSETSVISVDYPVEEIGWDCKVSTSYSAAMMPYYRELFFNIAIMIGYSFFSFILAVVIGQKLLKPVSSLRIASKKIMEGDYSARTYIRGTDEIGLAGEAFDKMAESVEQWYSVKTQFFTNISHELKTPLNVIFASVQLIDNYKTSLAPEVYSNKVSIQMKLIRQNCYRIMRIINNLIDISRHDSGFLKIKLTNYDMVKLIQEITLSVQRYVEGKGVELCFVSEVESETMACDPDIIERIMLNLISNAIKFTDKNGTIKVCIKKDGEDSLGIDVSDTGTGIPQDKLNQIFERFKQADDPFMKNKEGSGIGLSLVKAFVEAHGGKISVTSETLKGSTFHISLPIRTIDETDSSDSKDALKKGRPCTGSTGSISRINIEFSDIYP